jgi:hypothetical protein
MAYNTKYMLTDATGRNFIPQYYDPFTDTFKPLLNPKVRDSFSNTTNVTKNYTNPMCGFAIQNDGTANLTVTINGMTITVKPTEGFEENFEPFTQVQVVASGAFRAIVRG